MCLWRCPAIKCKVRIFNFIFLLVLFFNTAQAEEWLTPEFKEKNITNVADKITDRTSTSLWLAGAASSLYYQNYDTEFRNDWKDHQQMSVAVADTGNILGSGIATVGIIAGQYFWDKQKENWQSHARALAWETAVVTVMKYSFGKQRPGDKNAYVSFPSGHTATAFATATSLTYAYGWKAGLISYPLAVLVGASRMADDMHWISDVVAGAFVGVIIGRATYEGPFGQNNSVWVPVVGADNVGLTYIFRF